MQIVPAILVKTESECKEKFSNDELKAIAPLWQVDILDNSMFHETSFANPEKIKHFSPPKGIELHLMVENPLPIIAQWKKLIPQTKRAIIHAEISRPLSPIIDQIQKMHLEVGIALNPETDFKKYMHDLKRAHVILLLGVHPGQSGQAFLGDSILKKIEKAKSLFPDTIIAVDGGINKENIEDVVNAGAYQICASSSIWKTKDPQAAFINLLDIASIK